MYPLNLNNEMNVYILGAGASKSYGESLSGQKMPLATEVFSTFEKLNISQNPWVIIGDIVNYLHKTRNVPIESVFKGDLDIEKIHSAIEYKMLTLIEKDQNCEHISSELLILTKTYQQLVYFFSSIINEIQNGPTSKAHRLFLKKINTDDTIITFNWDTLLDRALQEDTDWETDFGYGFSPCGIYRDKWLLPQNSFKQSPKLIKLHGSTNWLTSPMYYDQEAKDFKLIQESPNDSVWIYEYATKPYPAYAGRYMEGYAPFSMGYYPPNILSDKGKTAPKDRLIIRVRPKFPWIPESNYPSDGMPSTPLIIPPVKNKSYNFWGKLFKNLWEYAESDLSKAESIYVIGYSFPITDIRAIDLLKKAFCKKTKYPNIIILNPNPVPVKNLFRERLGIPNKYIKIIKDYFRGEII